MLTWPSLKEKLLRPIGFAIAMMSRLINASGDSTYRTQKACKPFIGSDQLNNPIVKASSTLAIFTSISHNVLVRVPQMYQHCFRKRRPRHSTNVTTLQMTAPRDPIALGHSYYFILTTGNICLFFTILSAFNNTLRLIDHFREAEQDPNEDPLWFLLLSLSMALAQAYSFYSFTLTKLYSLAKQIQQAINHRPSYSSWQETIEVEFKPAQDALDWHLTLKKIIPIIITNSLIAGVGCTYGTYQSFPKLPMHALGLTPFSLCSRSIAGALSGTANTISTAITFTPALYNFFQSSAYPTIHSPYWRAYQAASYATGGIETLFNGMNVCNSFFFIVGGEHNNFVIQDLLSLNLKRTLVTSAGLVFGGIAAVSYWTFNIEQGTFRVYTAAQETETHPPLLPPPRSPTSPRMNDHSHSVTGGYGTFDNKWVNPLSHQNGHSVSKNNYRV